MPHVKIVEVGPRDGIQNISQQVSTKVKIELINRLADAGLSIIEATSFVSPKWVPQLVDAKQVLEGIRPLTQSEIGFPVLVPNLYGLELARQNGVKEVAVFVSASEGFSRKNINCSVDESLERVRGVTEKAKDLGIRVRGYVSCIFADPYDGPTNPSQVTKVTKYLLDHGCYEVSLGDTLGVGTVADVKRLLEELLKTIPASKLAGHFHDTYGQAIANVLQSYQMGIRTFDSSVAGLGGCPFAVGAKGNLSTEDLVYTLHSMGVSTGVDLSKLVSTGAWISQALGIPNGSRAGAALTAKISGPDVSKPSASKPKRNWKLVGSTNEYQVHRSGPNIKVCLTRPKNGNALTSSMIKGLTALFQKLAQDKSVFRIVLAGEGKFFCTGMDLSKDAGTPDERFSNLKGLFEAIDDCPQTTIAAVNGPCFGGGVGLAFVCDLRILTSGATVKLSEAQLGLCPAVISKYVIREWGINFARAAMLTAREVAPSELAALHVIYAVVKDGKALQGKVEDLLDDLRFSAPRASGLCKDLVRSAWRDAGGEGQDRTIRASFDAMMAEGSESTHALTLFQQGKRGIDWDVFTRPRPSKL
ncbi:3-hydroxy-3-methylglutaryl-coenzyme A lyase/3-methylglutaconyl-coenzyme A hydratase [Halenospora varia]|nr:3-hydroxy-3-methylglutaryl-coenzyme A lyase/3-methylglutaconyl-coenzyme A hydratase [Halenospora varia]